MRRYLVSFISALALARGIFVGKAISILTISLAGLMFWTGTSQAGMFDRIGAYPEPSAITSLPDGRILVAADFTRLGTIVIGYASDGSIDASFGDDGIWRSPLPEAHDPFDPSPKVGLPHIATQGDQAVVLDDSTLFRLTSDGQTDLSFGVEGRAEAPARSTLTVLPDSRILISGTDYRCYKASCTYGDSYLARFSPDGLPDQGFGVDGIARLDLRTEGTVGFFGAAIDESGRTYAAGGKVLARFDPAGQLDPAFGEGGLVDLPFNGYPEDAEPILLEDGLVTVAGPGSPWPIPGQTTLARFDSSGTTDSGFGDGGVAHSFSFDARTLSAGPGGFDLIGVNGVLCRGYVSCGMFGPAIARYAASGQLDRTWGEDGLAVHAIGRYWGTRTAAAFRQADGKTIFVASLPLKGGHWARRISLVRLDQNGSLDDSFGREGQVTTPESVPRCLDRQNFLYLAPGQNYRASEGSPTRVIGSQRRDHIAGADDKDVVCARGGGDTVKGEAQRDRLFAEAGPDRVNGGAGRDLLKGGTGNDRIFARDGFRDRVNCGPGRDVATVDPKDRVTACEKVRRRSGAIAD